MASLEEALTQSIDNEPIAPVNDVLVIDPEKRLINVPDSESLFGVFGENIVERKYFTCPRIVLNNIDLFECYIFINYISASGRIGYIQADDVVLDETENYIVFSWELTSNVFDKNMDSIIYFSVSAKQYVDDREPVFFTRKAQGKMYETVNGTEIIQEQYADIILQLLAKMNNVEQIATPEAMQAYVDNWLKENPSAIDGQPVPVETASGMLNTQTLYLYMGKGETVDEIVYEKGYIYYYVEDTQSWTKGSLYGGEGGGSSFSGNASDVSYDDTETKLGATNVQDAVGKLLKKMNNNAIVNATGSGTDGNIPVFDTDGSMVRDSGIKAQKISENSNKISRLEQMVTEHNISEESHNDIRLLISGLTTRLNALANSDDTTLDQMAEVVAYIKNNKSLIDGITTNKVSVSDIIDNLTSNVSNKPLSAKQGVALKALIDAIVVPTKTSQLQNDSGFLTQHQDLSSYAKKATTLAGYGITDGATKQAVQELQETVNDYSSHKANTAMHVTSAEKQVWNNKADASLLPTIVQEAGESETSVMSQKAVTDLVKETLGEAETIEYETVDSVDEMTDTSKSYVLKSTGTIWTYKEVTVEKVPENVFIPANATLNKRFSSSGEAVSNGMYLTELLEFDASTASSPIVWLPVGWASTTTNQKVKLLDSNKTSLRSADYYIASDKSTSGYLYVGQENGRYFVDLSKLTDNADANEYPSVKYIRLCLSSGVTTAITVDNIADVEILFEKDRGTTIERQWVDTEIEPSATGGSVNYVEMLVKVTKNESDIKEVSNRVTALETGAETLTIPIFWQSAVDECIAKIKALQVGRNCITFPFFSDNHQRNGYAGMLIAYIMKECNIPYAFFGGDSISSGTIADEATMIEQDRLFDLSMSYIPNGRFCRAVGNHDGYWYDGTNKFYYNRDQVYELFLREESIAQNKHFGDDGTYYYVDDIASKTRFIVMDTNGGSVDATQIAWVQNIALSFNESGWGVVFISHQPISNHYHAGISNAKDVATAISTSATSKNVPIMGWYSGHVHRDIMSTKVHTGGNGSNVGTENGDLGFTQVIITSDHTGIAYDDATKHTVANDDKSHAIDFVTINKNTRTVNITRLGIGEDRSYTY